MSGAGKVVPHTEADYTRHSEVETYVAKLEVERDEAIAAARAATEERDAVLASVRAQVDEARSVALAERDDAERRNVELAADLAAARSRLAKLELGQVDRALADARRAGKLRTSRDADGKVIDSPIEARLRRIAAKEGLDALAAEIEAMPPIVPLGRVELSNVDPNPKPTVGAIPGDVLASTAAQLELVPADLAEHADHLTGGRGPGAR